MHNQDPSVLHRDIKPSNIKITPAGNVKLVDFGLVKVMVPDDQRTITVVQGRGTVQYLPLEQYGGDTGHTDVRSDIYSLGATLYHLLTGKPPLDAKERFLKPNLLPTPRSLNPSLSPQTERAILRSLAMHPDDRPVSIAELREELFAPSSVSRAVGQIFGREQPLAQFVRVNRGILALIGTLLLAATLVTARPATLPPSPTATPSATPTVTAQTPTLTPRPTRTVTALPIPTRTRLPAATLTVLPTNTLTTGTE
jgi:serine/threonine-protein kinase